MIAETGGFDPSFEHFEDWELWVVGDACTDDSEGVVRSFGDERVRFACDLDIRLDAHDLSLPSCELAQTLEHLRFGFRCRLVERVAGLGHLDTARGHLAGAMKDIDLLLTPTLPLPTLWKLCSS